MKKGEIPPRHSGHNDPLFLASLSSTRRKDGGGNNELIMTWYISGWWVSET